MIKYIKKKLLSIKRKRLLKVDSNNYEVKLFGSNYGGFSVYTKKLKKKDFVVYSFGIGEDLTFSEAIMEAYNPNIYAFDPTPKSIKYVSEHKLNKCENFHFFPIGLSNEDGMCKFYLPVNEEYVSGSTISHTDVKKEGIDVKMECLNTIAHRLGHSKIDILKMDIEGTEFSVINGLQDCSVEIEQICVEVHDRFFDNGLEMLDELLQKLHALDYILISVSDNGEEMTFIKNINQS